MWLYESISTQSSTVQGSYKTEWVDWTREMTPNSISIDKSTDQSALTTRLLSEQFRVVSRTSLFGVASNPVTTTSGVTRVEGTANCDLEERGCWNTLPRMIERVKGILPIGCWVAWCSFDNCRKHQGIQLRAEYVPRDVSTDEKSKKEKWVYPMILEFSFFPTK
jgi:hypothetical protein